MSDTDRELSADEAMDAMSAASRKKLREIDGDDRMNGTVKKILVDKGFGFLTDEGGVDRFFHKDGCLANFEGLQSGDRVTFTATDGRKGPRAEGVDIVAQ